MNRKKTPTPLLNPTTADLEAALDKIHNKEIEKETEKEFYNYNLRIPADIHGRIQQHIKKSGQNMKGFLLVSILEYLDKQG
jgi:hypothetical protein